MCEKCLLELVSADSVFRAEGHYGGAEGPAQGLQQVQGRGQRLPGKCHPAPCGVRPHPAHQVPYHVTLTVLRTKCTVNFNNWVHCQKFCLFSSFLPHCHLFEEVCPKFAPFLMKT
jgi:hypothetical protein